VELQIYVEDTNQPYKVYYNRGYYPTLPEYYRYLSENLNLSNPHTFVLRREGSGSSWDVIKDVGELVDGIKLILSRQKNLNGSVNPEERITASGKRREAKTPMRKFAEIKDEGSVCNNSTPAAPYTPVPASTSFAFNLSRQSVQSPHGSNQMTDYISQNQSLNHRLHQ